MLHRRHLCQSLPLQWSLFIVAGFGWFVYVFIFWRPYTAGVDGGPQ